MNHMNAMQNEALIEARTRQANADAALKELRYEKLSERLVDRKEFEAELFKEWEKVILNVKSKVLAVVTLAQELAHQDRQACYDILKRWSVEVCNELAGRTE